ncbi:MAG: hypothetical protein IT360_14620 [Gemmatimonadaceae bacterium]|nr:hypothetical protein [Gemmatimonadaceae bacterium]
MMTHLETGTIQALVHGELSPVEQAAAIGHEAVCEPCRAAVSQARREDAWVRGRLAALDETPPAVADVMPRVPRTPQRAQLRTRWGRAATVLVMLGGASLAWAMPTVRGPVMAWLGKAFRDATSRVAEPTPVVQLPTPTASPGSGVSVMPGARFTVTVAVSQQAGTVFVRVVDGADLSVRASGGNVSLESLDEALLVRNPDGDGDYFVEIPRTAPRVEVRVNATRLVLVEHGVIAPAGIALDTGWTSYPIR